MVTYITDFKNAAKQFNRYTPMPVFIFGLIGNIFNLFIFTRRSLLINPCTIYLLSSTCTNILVLFFGLVIRSLMDGFGIDIIGNSVVLCRFRYFILHPSFVLSSWFLVLASIDRFCISSRNIRLRNLSTIKNARICVIVSSCFCLLLYSHVCVLFDIELRSSGPYCYAQVGTYRVVYDFLFFATFSFVPPILMMLIGLTTIRNILVARNRTNTINNSQLNKKDRQLILMLLVQLISTITCTLPHAIQKLYSTFTLNYSKGEFQLAVESLITHLTRQLLYINASISFYL